MRARASTAADGIFHQLGEGERARDRRGGSGLHDGAGDAAAVVVFAVTIDQIGERDLR